MRVDRAWRILRLRARAILRRGRVERELDEELAYHLDRAADAYVARGLAPDEARAAALRDMEGLERRKDECRDARGVRLADDLRLDVGYALRTLAASPTFTAVAIGTLALGIGAAVGVFTVVNAVLLRPLPIAEPERLAVILAEDAKLHGRVGASWTKFEQLAARRTVFDKIAAYVPREFAVGVGDAPSQVAGARVSAGFFGVLGVAPASGRTFSPAEDVEGAAPVAIVTDAFWHRALGGDPGAVGRSIRVDARETTIVGVLPPGFRFQFSDGEPQLFLTCVFTPGVMTAAQIRHGSGFLEYVARLEPGATVEQARRDLAAFDAQYRRDFGSYTDAGKYVLALVPFVDNLVGAVRPALFVLSAAVVLLLLIACANVAHLMLSRAAARQREVAVRLALGASLGRLTRQFLTEGLVLAAAGGAIGLVAARAAVALLVARAPGTLPRLADTTPDARVLAFAVLAACATAVAFSLAPALRLRRLLVASALRDGRGGGLAPGTGRLHRCLAASQSAVTIVLLVTAGLLFESLVRLHTVDIGFDPSRVYATQLSLPVARYSTPYQREAFFTTLLQDLRSQPGVEAAGATSYLPMSGSNFGFFFFVDGQPHRGPGRDPVTSARHVSAGYFRVMRIALRKGRTFTDADAAGSQPVAIVNETFAARYLAGKDPIGRHVANSGDGVMREIVGVVADVRFDGPARERQEELYLPYRQVPWPSMTVVVSSALSTDAVAGTVRRAVARIDPDQAFSEIRPMPSIVATATTQEQFTTSLVGAFAVLATLLAGVGLYGVVALFVGQKRHEFGVRMALGAQRSDVLWLVMREGGALVGSGIAIGLAGAAAASSLVRGLLFGVSATAPTTYAAAAVALTAIGALASYLPARRAVSLAPLDALRAE